MKIAILDDYADAARQLKAWSKLAGHDVISFRDHVADPAVLGKRLEGFEAVVLIQQRCWFPRAVVEELPDSVRLLSQTGPATAHIDVAACTARGIAITAAGKSNHDAPAQLAWALILASRRHIPQETAALKSGRWLSTIGREINGRTLGIYAYGNIGSIVAAVGRAFGMRVICWGRAGSTARARAAGYEIPSSREEFFETSDIVSIHLPLRPETRGIVTAADLARMKPDALFVNVSRAGLVGDKVLADALTRGRPGRAAVDVYETEPVLDSNHPLVRLENCLCSPHLGYNAEDTLERYLGGAFDRVVAYASGKPVDIVNPDAMREARLRQ